MYIHYLHIYSVYMYAIYTDMYRDMYTDTYTDMYTDMYIHIYQNSLPKASPQP